MDFFEFTSLRPDIPDYTMFRPDLPDFAMYSKDHPFSVLVNHFLLSDFVDEEERNRASIELLSFASGWNFDEERPLPRVLPAVVQETVITELNETLELMKKDLALKDDVIHGLKTKLGLPVDDVAVIPLPEENKAVNESNVDVNGFTVPPVKREDENSENVIPVPSSPDENSYSSQFETLETTSSTELERLKAYIIHLEWSVSEKEKSLRALKLDLAETTAQLEQNGVEQEAIIIKLNETLELMRKDLALKDDVIHGLKTKLGLPVDDVAVIPLPEENKAANGSNVDVNGFTVPPVKREDDNSENVIPVPNKPDENGHLSALDIPDEKNSADVYPNDKPAENADKLPVGAGNVVVRDAQTE